MPPPFLAALAALAFASPPCCPPPARGPSPLLYVRIAGPAGSRVTLFQGRAAPRTFPSPAVVGLRPGYCYRFMLSDLPGRPGLALYPTVQVRDSLHLSPNLNAANHPATLTIDDDDVDAIASGSLLAKLVYLEHPDLADPQATRPDETLQTNYPPHTDIWREATQRGRPMLLMHLGERTPSAEELAQQNVPGTILHPNDRSTGGMPARPPHFALGCAPRFDPILGPRPPEEECFHDGGDRGRKASLDGCGGLTGLDPEDTVATFRDSQGNKHVVCSNRVCICVPRFLALRTECPLQKAEGVLVLDAAHRYLRQEQLRRREPALLAFRYDQVRGYDGKKRPTVAVNTNTPNELVGLKVLEAVEVDLGVMEFLGAKKLHQLTPVQKVKLARQIEFAQQYVGSKRVSEADQVTVTSVVGRIDGTQEVVSELPTREITVCCHETPTLPDKPLMLIKCADKQAANIGDVITFLLRYSNVGGRAIADVAVTDSLSGRLEYVEGSASSDRDAVFTMQKNEAGSLVLRWEVSGKLQPGESGKIRFQARVR